MVRLSVFSFSALVIFLSSTSAFSTMIGKDEQVLYNDTSEVRPLKQFKIQNDKKDEISFDFSGISDFIKQKTQERSEFDDKLNQLNGKNLSHSPSKEMYEFIEQKVGSSNKKPFVFKTGPQVIFEDDIDLSR